MFWIGLGVGFIVGGGFGTLITALCVASKMGDEQ